MHKSSSTSSDSDTTDTEFEEALKLKSNINLKWEHWKYVHVCKNVARETGKKAEYVEFDKLSKREI